MPTIVVNVMPRPELLDPQGQAVTRALADLGMADVTAVRAGKRFVLQIAGPVTDDVLARTERVAGELLANPVIEEYTVQVDDPGDGG
jgi:phosphoribosylformylglycinamidine synthase PurS subunit